MNRTKNCITFCHSPRQGFSRIIVLTSEKRSGIPNGARSQHERAEFICCEVDNGHQQSNEICPQKYSHYFPADAFITVGNMCLFSNAVCCGWRNLGWIPTFYSEWNSYLDSVPQNFLHHRCIHLRHFQQSTSFVTFPNFETLYQLNHLLLIKIKFHARSHESHGSGCFRTAGKSNENWSTFFFCPNSGYRLTGRVGPCFTEKVRSSVVQA